MIWVGHLSSVLQSPSEAALYFRQMVEYGKTRKQAMGAVMSHLGARVYAVLKEQRPYQVREHDGRPMSRIEAGHLIRERFRVPAEVRRLCRHCHRPTKKSIREESLSTATGHWNNATIDMANLSICSQGLRITCRAKFYNHSAQTHDTI